MRKISEAKALEKIPERIQQAYWCDDEVMEFDANQIERQHYTKGYDDALSDVLERLKSINRNSMNHLYYINEIDKIIKEFS